MTSMHTDHASSSGEGDFFDLQYALSQLQQPNSAPLSHSSIPPSPRLRRWRLERYSFPIRDLTTLLVPTPQSVSVAMTAQTLPGGIQKLYYTRKGQEKMVPEEKEYISKLFTQLSTKAPTKALVETIIPYCRESIIARLRALAQCAHIVPRQSRTCSQRLQSSCHPRKIRKLAVKCKKKVQFQWECVRDSRNQIEYHPTGALAALVAEAQAERLEKQGLPLETNPTRSHKLIKWFHKRERRIRHRFNHGFKSERQSQREALEKDRTDLLNLRSCSPCQYSIFADRVRKNFSFKEDYPIIDLVDKIIRWCGGPLEEMTDVEVKEAINVLAGCDNVSGNGFEQLGLDAEVVTAIRNVTIYWTICQDLRRWLRIEPPIKQISVVFVPSPTREVEVRKNVLETLRRYSIDWCWQYCKIPGLRSLMTRRKCIFEPSWRERAGSMWKSWKRACPLIGLKSLCIMGARSGREKVTFCQHAEMTLALKILQWREGCTSRNRIFHIATSAPSCEWCLAWLAGVNHRSQRSALLRGGAIAVNFDRGDYRTRDAISLYDAMRRAKTQAAGDYPLGWLPPVGAPGVVEGVIARGHRTVESVMQERVRRVMNLTGEAEPWIGREFAAVEQDESSVGEAGERNETGDGAQRPEEHEISVQIGGSDMSWHEAQMLALILLIVNAGMRH